MSPSEFSDQFKFSLEISWKFPTKKIRSENPSEKLFFLVVNSTAHLASLPDWLGLCKIICSEKVVRITIAEIGNKASNFEPTLQQ